MVSKISFFKLGRSFIKKGESSFQHIVNEVLNFKLVCVSVFIPTSTKLVIFEVMQNLVNFISKNPVISKPIDKKCQKENIKEIEENDSNEHEYFVDLILKQQNQPDFWWVY